MLLKNAFTSLLVVVFVSAYGQIPLDNLQGYYPFNGNANDESTYSHDGTVSGPTLTTDRHGNPNSAYNFAGGTDIITIDHSPELNFNAFTGDFSVCVWFRSANPLGSLFSTKIIGKWISSPGPRPFWWRVMYSPVFDYDYAQFLDWDGSTQVSVNADTTLFDGNWHLNVMIVTADSIYSYVDGVYADASHNALTVSAENDGQIQIGNGIALNEGYQGDLDDIRLYWDSLAPCEIWALYIENDTNYHSYETVDVCPGDDYTFPDGNTISNITADTVYESHFPFAGTGCDSAIIHTTINIVTIDAGVTQAGITLTANASGLTYQWVDCDAAYSSISGATAQNYTATTNGNYAVILTDGSCSDTSDCILIQGSGLSENAGDLFMLYPNPAKNIIYLTFSEKPNDDALIRVIDLEGRELMRLNNGKKKMSIDVSALETGVYLVEVDGVDGKVRKRFVVE